jgi:hypothetical protein
MPLEAPVTNAVFDALDAEVAMALFSISCAASARRRLMVGEFG